MYVSNLPMQCLSSIIGGLVDPFSHPNQDSLPPAMDDSDEGMNYLRRLKGKPGDSAAKTNVKSGSGTLAANKAADVLPPIGAHSTFIERRKDPRYSCSGRIQMQVEGANYRLGGTLTNISLHGCYVEMNNTYPVGTKLNLELDVISMKIELPGIVRATYPFLGMGIYFGQPEAKILAQLQELLVALAARTAAYGVLAQ
jgi:PilZ domain